MREITDIPESEITAWFNDHLPAALLAEVRHQVTHGRKNLTLHIYERETGEQALFRRQDYSAFEQKMTEGDIRLDMPAYSGLGVVTMYLFEEFFRQHGYTHNELYAGGTNGSYTWAQYGFIPVARHRAYLANELEKKIEKLNTIIYDSGFCVGADSLSLLATNINDLNSHSKKVRDIANFKLSLDDFVAVRPDASYQKLLNSFDDQFLSVGEDRKGTIKIGQWLLTGERWDGVLNFADAEAMAIRDAYVRRAYEKLFTNSFAPVLQGFTAPKQP